MKAILVIDMPENCMECPLRYKDGDTDDWFRFRCFKSEDQIPKEGRLWNCELKPIPQKKILDEELFMLGNFRLIQARFTGWNDCIDTITGETE